jgi:hypothetical protein
MGLGSFGILGIAGVLPGGERRRSATRGSRADAGVRPTFGMVRMGGRLAESGMRLAGRTIFGRR